jgi:hypothetical protein
MPMPLSDEFAAVLRLDSTAALAALTVIAASNRDLLAWAASALAAPPAAVPRRGPKPNGKHRRRSRRESCDDVDKRLLEAMRDSPDSTINDWAKAIGKSRSSTVTALHRLQDADLAESVGGKWRLIEPSAPREPVPRWVEPMSATSERRRGRSLTSAKSAA